MRGYGDVDERGLIMQLTVFDRAGSEARRYGRRPDGGLEGR